MCIGGENAGCNAHGHELLEEQLAGVGHMNLADLGFATAVAAIEFLLGQVGYGNETTPLADVDAVWVTVSIEAVFDKVGRPMSHQAVPFHLPHAQPSLASSALHGLAGQHRDWSSGSCMKLVVD